jgi:L-asparagine oxygenase
MEEFIIDFNKKEIDVLVNLAKSLKTSPSKYPDLFCVEAKRLADKIPGRIREHLIEFSKRGSKSGFLLLRGLPVDLSVPTPTNNNERVGETTNLAKIQGILMESISELVAYEAEGYGRIFQDVVPVQAMAKDQTSVGSNAELEIHTEQAFSRLRPDILSLACLRGDVNAKTYILPVGSIMSHMTPEEKYLLRLQLWKTGVDLSFKLHGQEFIEGDVRGPMPIIHGEEEDPFLRFDQDLMYSLNEFGIHLLKKIVAIYYEVRGQHNLMSGEIILIDNNRAVHGRSPFFPRYDGSDRFLVRCFGTFDYEKTAHARKGRTISAIYS